MTGRAVRGDWLDSSFMTQVPPHDHRRWIRRECRLDRQSDVQIVASWRPGKWSETAPLSRTRFCPRWIVQASRSACSARGTVRRPDDPWRRWPQYCRRHPDRFIGIASVDLFRPMEAVRELRLRVKRDGFKGCAFCRGLGPAARRPPLLSIVAECCELDIPFCAGRTCRAVARSEPGRPIPYLDRVALEFSELRILSGHIGVPWLNEMFSLVMKYPNVFIDVGLQGQPVSI